MYIHCENWFKSHSLQDYPSKKSYMNDFLKYDACGNSSESRPITALEIISQKNQNFYPNKIRQIKYKFK